MAASACVSEYNSEFFTLLNAKGKKELIEWCMNEGLIASNYECPKCNERMGLCERKSAVLDGFVKWRESYTTAVSNCHHSKSQSKKKLTSLLEVDFHSLLEDFEVQL
ncbi:uncharacterized protein TNCV_1786231 [Trichonephila clavipes]|nr:uncharacterized protein TNCV_1786231 [Trichonephila clavipes]